MRIGRPPYEITAKIIAKVEKLAAQGLAEYQIAAVLGIHPDTLIEKKKAYPDFSDAIKNGKAKGIATITNKLFQKAGEGDTTSMIFYLKNRDPENWMDVNNQRITVEDITPEQRKNRIAELLAKGK